MLGYTSWHHQLFVCSCNSCLFVFIHAVIQLSFSCLFIMLFSYLLCGLSYYYFVHIVYMHEHFSLHTLGNFLTILDFHVQIFDAFLYCSGVRWDRTLREVLDFLPIWFRYSYLSYLPVIFWFSIYQFSCYSSSLFIWNHVWMVICDIVVIMIHYTFDL